MPKRSMFQMIFGNKKQNPENYKAFTLLNGQQAVWTNPSSNLYSYTQIRACIDAIARNAAKLSPKHLRKYYDSEGKYRIDKIDDRIQTLVSKKPNEFMNAYDFYYKTISELELNNDAYIYIVRDDQGTPLSLYPIKAGSYKVLEHQGNTFLQFTFGGGKTYIASIKDDVIHLKRFYCENDIIGGTTAPIIKTMSIKHVIDEGIVNAIKTTQDIKGLIKSTKTMLKPEDVELMRKNFVKNFIENSDGSGIGALDGSHEFQEVHLNPQTATDGQVNRIDDEVMNYFGVNKNILQNNYTEDQWNAFYEGKLEGLGVQMGLEFTNKLFSYGERWHGNEIVFEANRLQYASTQSKINLLKEAGALGIMTRNEAREVLNLGPVDNGDEIIQSLNYTNIIANGGNKNE